MGHVVEAFRFLSARVETLEARLADQDRPVEGAAWLAPARELGPWAGPVAAHVLARRPGGDIVHADCGEGVLLDALAGAAWRHTGWSPAARSRLQRARARVLGDHCRGVRVPGQPALRLAGGVVLSGVVDRLPLHALFLSSPSRRALARGAPLVVVSEPAAAAASWEASARDLTRVARCTRRPGNCCWTGRGSSRWPRCPMGPGRTGRFALSAAAPS